MYKDLKNAALDILDCINRLERLQAENKELRERTREMEEWQREQLRHNEYMSVTRLQALLGRPISEIANITNVNMADSDANQRLKESLKGGIKSNEVFITGGGF